MTANVISILEQAMKLAESDRSEIAYRLIETLSAPSEVLSVEDDHFLEELERRFEDTAGSRPWAEIRDEEP